MKMHWGWTIIILLIGYTLGVLYPKYGSAVKAKLG